MAYGNSKSVWPPIGILSLSSSLLARGYDVSIVDGILEGYEQDSPIDDNTFLMGLRPEELAGIILKHTPDVVGFSILFVNQIENALHTARIVRKYNSDIFLLWGGPIVTLKSQYFILIPEVDGIILGESDISGPEFIDKLQSKKARPIPGTGIRCSKGFELDIAFQPVHDLDILPLPARDLIDMRCYMDKVQYFKVLPKQLPATTIMTSRGCPFKCIFCSAPVLYNNSYRYRSPKNVLDEIDLLVNKYGIKEFIILDENFCVNRERTEKLIDLIIERDYGITWYAASGMHVMTLTEKILEKMVSSGLYKLKVSFESGNERVLKEIIHKNIDLKYGETIIKKAKELGLAVGANFILGFPWETRLEILDSFEYAKQLDLDFTLWTLATPYPHTHLTERAIKEGLLPNDFDFTDLIPGRAYFDLVDVSRAELEKWREEFWEKLNFCNAEKSRRYYQYALVNPNYRPPIKPDKSI